MKQIHLMELVRLQVGDVILERHWRMDEIKQVPAPNQELKTDEMGRWVDNVFPRMVTRIKFTCTQGAWYGYLFPETGDYVNIHYNGATETIKGGGKIDLVSVVQLRDLPGVKESTLNRNPPRFEYNGIND